jgi:hypothetical protein
MSQGAASIILESNQIGQGDNDGHPLLGRPDDARGWISRAVPGRLVGSLQVCREGGSCRWSP